MFKKKEKKPLVEIRHTKLYSNDKLADETFVVVAEKLYDTKLFVRQSLTLTPAQFEDLKKEMMKYMTLEEVCELRSLEKLSNGSYGRWVVDECNGLCTNTGGCGPSRIISKEELKNAKPYDPKWVKHY